MITSGVRVGGLPSAHRADARARVVGERGESRSTSCASAGRALARFQLHAFTPAFKPRLIPLCGFLFEAHSASPPMYGDPYAGQAHVFADRHARDAVNPGHRLNPPGAFGRARLSTLAAPAQLSGWVRAEDSCASSEVVAHGSVLRPVIDQPRNSVVESTLQQVGHQPHRHEQHKGCRAQHGLDGGQEGAHGLGGLRLGLLRHLLHAPERRLYPITNGGRQVDVIRPAGNSLWRDADCPGSSCRSAAKETDCFSLVHDQLNHAFTQGRNYAFLAGL